MFQNSIQRRNEFKVIILGEAGVGKTTLVYRYVFNDFLQRVDCTLRFDLYTKKVVVEEGEAALEIWDTAGMERFRAITRDFVRNAKAAIVCMDVTYEKSSETLCYCINQIKHDDCKVYICCTKNDLVKDSNRVVSQRLMESIANELNYKLFMTNSQTGEGIDGMFQEIASDLLISNAKKENVVLTSNTTEEKGTIGLNDEKEKKSWAFCHGYEVIVNKTNYTVK